MKIGAQYILIETDYSAEAYRDQFDLPQEGYVVKREIRVTVTEVRTDVPGLWGREKNYHGWKAMDAHGKVYTCNWKSFPDDSMTPTYYWDVMKDFVDGETYYWRPEDALQAVNSFPHVWPDGRPYIPFGMKKCPTHKYYYDPDEEFGCWRCHLESIRVK